MHTGTPTRIPIIDSVVDSYGTVNQNDQYTISSPGVAIGQAFTGNGRKLESVEFYIKNSSVPGTETNLTAYLYAETHATAFGVDSVATGSSLATSSTIGCPSSLSDLFQMKSFVFDGTFVMTAGTKYVILVFIGGSGSSRADVGIDTSTLSHSGNAVSRVLFPTAHWTAIATNDVIFSVHGVTDPFYVATPTHIGTPTKFP